MKKKYRIIILLLIMAVTITSLSLPSRSIFAKDEGESEDLIVNEDNLLSKLDRRSFDDPLSSLPIPNEKIEEDKEPEKEKKETVEESVMPTVPEKEEITENVEKADIQEEVVEEEPAAPIEENKTVEQETTPLKQERELSENWFIFNPNNNTIVGYSSSPDAPKDIVIPRQIEGVDVLYIADNAFTGLRLTSLTLSEGLLKIGNNAFSNNITLAGNVTIPSTVNEMGTSAFEGDTGITSLNILGDLIIGDNTFYNCTGLSTVAMSGNIISIGRNAFNNCYNLVLMTLSEGLENIGEGAFYGCRGLTTITIPNSVTSIGANAFFDCRGLTTITIPNNVTSIGNSAFSGCSGLTTITIPNSVTSIGVSTFSGCSGLTTITIPNSVTSIGDSAFSSCSGLTTITIPNSVTSIGNSAFYNCRGLTTITIPNSVTSIGSSAFSSCSGLTTITIPNSVTSIGNGAFYGCGQLKAIYIDKSTGSISGSPWGATTGVLLIWSDSGLAIEGDYVFNCNNNTIIRYDGNDRNVNIPGSFEVNGTVYPVKGIGNNLFSGKGSLETVIIPNGVTSIGDSAFYNCRGLTTITIPNSVTSIGNSAFSYCSGLTTITIPNSITSIGNSAFYGCGQLKNIYIDKSTGSISGSPWGATSSIVIWSDSTIVEVGDYLFEYATGTILRYDGSDQNISIPASFEVDGTTYPVKVIGKKSFSYKVEITSIIIPNSVLTIKEEAFSDCVRLTSVTIPNGVLIIESQAFYDCASLVSVELPNSITSIGVLAFSRCSKLKTIYIDKSTESLSGSPWGATSSIVIWSDSTIVEVGDYLFEYATGTILKYDGSDENISIPASFEVDGTTYPVKVIGNSAFKDKTFLKTVTLPNGITSIGNSAFLGCSGLTSIILPNSLVSIEANAFYGCVKLTTINIPERVTTIREYAFYKCTELRTISINKPTASLSGSPWGATSSIVIWSDNTLIEIGDYIFDYGNRTIVKFYGNSPSLNIPASFEVDGSTYPVEAIGNNVFSGKTFLTTVIIPNGVTSIGFSTFSSCSGLTSITIPSSVTSIGNSAFSYCSGLTTITIQNGVTSIGDSAFSYCNALTTITIPNSVTSIGTNAFMSCNGLRTILIDKPTGSISDSPWQATSSIVIWSDSTIVEAGDYIFNYGNHTIVKYFGSSQNLNIPASFEVNGTTYPVKRIGDSVFKNNNFRSVILPSGLLSIGIDAFYGSSYLTSITIPSSVTSIGNNAFYSSYNLKVIDITSKTAESISGSPWGMSDYGSSGGVVLWHEVQNIDGFIFDSRINTIIKYIGTDENVIMPSSIYMNEEDYVVTSIVERLFDGNIIMTSLKFSDNLTAIPDYAVSYCENLKSVIIPEGVESIGSNAFYRCDLREIIIPDSVTSIGAGAFSSNESLKVVKMSANLSVLDGNIFDYTSSLESIYMNNSKNVYPATIVAAQPWGGLTANVYYAGEIPSFEHTVANVQNEFARDIKIKAFVTAPNQLRMITLPNGKVINLVGSNWPESDLYSYRVTSNGTYIFRGEDTNGEVAEYPVVINDIGVITVNANSGTLNENTAQTMTKQDILNFVGANAHDELGLLPGDTLTISDADLAKINALTDGNSETIRVTSTSNRSGAVMTAYKDVTLIGSSCTINIINNNLWRTQAQTITKEQLKTILGASVSFSDDTAVDMSKLTISDADLAVINRGIVGSCSIWLTYDEGIGRRRFEINILDDSPSALIQIPEQIQMSKVVGESQFVAEATEEVAIASITDTNYFPENFYIRSDPTFTIVNEESGDEFRVQVYDESDTIYTNSNDNLAVLNGSGETSKGFILKAWNNFSNEPGIYRGIMNFYIAYGEEES